MQTLTRTCTRAIVLHMSNPDEPTGLTLKVERVAARVKGVDLAAEMGVSPSRLSAIEREQYPSADIVQRYRAALATCKNVRTLKAA